MARCAHAKSTYKLRQLPRCSKCKIQFILIMVSYDNKPKPVYEWECPRCHKVVARHKLKENPATDFENFLNEWCKDDTRKHNRDIKEHSNRKTMQHYSGSETNLNTNS